MFRGRGFNDRTFKASRSKKLHAEGERVATSEVAVQTTEDKETEVATTLDKYGPEVAITLPDPNVDDQDFVSISEAPESPESFEIVEAVAEPEAKEATLDSADQRICEDCILWTERMVALGPRNAGKCPNKAWPDVRRSAYLVLTDPSAAYLSTPRLFSTWAEARAHIRFGRTVFYAVPGLDAARYICRALGLRDPG